MISNKNNKRSISNLFLLKYLMVILTLFIVLSSNSNVFAEKPVDTEKPLSEPPRYRLFNLKHISVEQAQNYLNTAHVNVKSERLRNSMISITGQRTELIQASGIIKLVDADDKFIIKTISIATKSGNLPSNEKIAAQIGDIIIGSFSEPPTGTGPKAIINLQDEKLLVIAPIDKFNQIEKIIAEALPKPKKTQTEPNALPNSNEPSKIAAKTLADTNDLVKPDTNDLEKVTDINTIEIIDANSLAASDVNVTNLDNVFNMLVTSLEKPAVTKPRIAVEKVTKAAIPVEANEPNIPPVEKKKEEIEKPQKKQEPAQIRSYKPELIVDGNELLTVEFPEKLKIVDLLGLAGEYLHLNYMYDPAQVQGEVTLKLLGKSTGPLKVKDLYPILESVLKFNGLAMTRTENNLVIIAPKDQAKDIDPAFIDAKKGKVRIGDVLVTSFFELKHIDAESAKNLLASMNLGVDINTSASQADVILVTGYAHRMPRIEQLLNLVDIPGEEKEFRFRQLKYTMATNLKDKIKTLAEQLGTVSITVAATAAALPTTSPRRPGESEAAYRARIAREARTRRPTPTPTPSPTTKPTVHLDVDDRTNRILMIGMKDQLDIVENLIDTLDVEQQDMRSLKVYEIQNVDAGEVTGKLQELGIISTTPSTGRTRTTRTTQRTPVSTRTTPGAPPGSRITTQVAGVAEQEPLVEEPQVVIIESTNSLLVNATAEQHAQIAMIIGFVDAEPEEASINYVVYPLENQDPGELADILNQLIQETVEQRDPSGKVVRTETTKKTEEDITIIADKNTFSLIVYASKKNQQWINSLIKQLDKRRPQVLIDVTLVEVTKNDEFNYDLNLISSFPDLLTKTSLTGVISGEGEGAITSSTIMDQLNNAHRKRFIDVQSDSGVGTGFYGDKHINLLIRALQKKGYGRVLARPKLLVNDNQTGIIEATEVTYVTREKVTYRKGVNEEDIPITEKTFEPYDAGITLNIEPHISEGELLQLKITMIRKDFRFAGETGGEKPPDTVTSNVETTVTLPNGATIILGGLEKIAQSKGGTKVPLLGDIPFIGGLFRSISNKNTQSRLYVFIKAHIVRPTEQMVGTSDIEIVSRKNRAKFESYEKEMQEYKDWPGIKPKPMDPIKILEDD